MNISIKIADVTFKNPVTVASGTFGHEQRYYNLEEVKRIAAIIPKTVTLHPQVGNPPPRIFETPSGMINAIGIENPGIDAFLSQKLPALKKIGVPLIISILGHDEEQFTGIIEKLNIESGIAAVELNLSCPNLKHKVLVAQDPVATTQLVSKVKALSKFPIIAKLSPNVTDIAEMAQAAQDGGADAVSLVNTFSAMAIDIKTRKSRIGNFSGGLSGPAIRPIALYMVQKAASQVKIPVIGMGGIMTASDAIEFLIAGASMVAVGTANFINPRAPIDVLEGIEAYMKENKINDIREIIGSLKK
jgi:dihydroorotate dehydrogenase (NAD+) catalytic subunit